MYKRQASTFPVAATGTIAGVQGMPKLRSPLPVSRKSVMSISHNPDDLAADAVTGCQVPCLHLVLGRQSIVGDSLQHIVVKGHACCILLCGKMLDPAHFLKRIAHRRYLKTIKTSREARFGPSCLRAVPRKERVPRFPRRSTCVQLSLPLKGYSAAKSCPDYSERPGK